ncbi:MAG: GGDEF domain-containing protein [Lachnospiraceae bacterium]|nr:GGDEF domain-containing protein [Lachnospiraceae bacterium]
MIDGKRIIVLCTTRIHDASGQDFVNALNENVVKRNGRLLVYNTCSDLYWNTPSESGEKTVFQLIDYDVTDAVIIFEERIRDKTVVREIIEKAVTHRIPTVTIGDDYEGCTGVRFHYEAGIEQMTRHVIEAHGIKKLHFMAGAKGNPFSERRLAAFKRVLEEKDMPFTDEMISYGDFWSEPARTAMGELLKRDSLPEAVICANDAMALAVSSFLSEHGYRVPEDVIVTGFDGVDDIKYSMPKISSCLCDYQDMADEIMIQIQKCFEGSMPDKNCYVVPRMLLSESCGCAKVSTVNDAAAHLSRLNNIMFRYQEEERTLYEMSSRIQMCRTMEQVAKELQIYVLYDMCILINDECMDETMNPMENSIHDNFNKDKWVLFDSEVKESFVPHKISPEKCVPDMAGLLQKEQPLIFTALSFQDIPLGYVCFYYEQCNMENYCKIPQITNTLNNAVGGLRNMRYQRYITGQIEEMYKMDVLTGLYNRNGFTRVYKELLKSRSKERRCISVILADLDSLKFINDNFGHDEGDNAIVTVARALKEACPPGTLCTRLGGDEMFAVYDGVVDAVQIKRCVDSLLEQYNLTSGKGYMVSASTGIYITDNFEETDLESLIKKADKLMYQDKTQKKKQRI